MALRIGSQLRDAGLVVADVGQEVPLLKPVLKTLRAVRKLIDTVRNNEQALETLCERCTYITACLIVGHRRRRRRISRMLHVEPLENLVEEVERFVQRCQRRRSAFHRVLKASEVEKEIARLSSSADSLTSDVSLAGIAILVGRVDELKAHLVRSLFACFLCCLQLLVLE